MLLMISSVACAPLSFVYEANRVQIRLSVI